MKPETKCKSCKSKKKVTTKKEKCDKCAKTRKKIMPYVYIGFITFCLVSFGVGYLTYLLYNFFAK